MRLSSTIIERCHRREQGRIGAFRLGRILGIGATSAVYEAVKDAEPQPLAVKVLHVELRTSKDACARLARQVDVSEKVIHPSVVRIHGLVEESADTLLVMDRLVGETMAARMARSPRRIDAAEAVGWMRQVLSALDVVHSAGIVHRDLKPANLFLRDDGDRPVLLDFGSALVHDDKSITRTGQYLGTPAFMPPELAAGHPHDADERSDLWSLAATVFFVLSGEFVHPARSAAQQVLYAATQPARSLRLVRPDLDSAIITAIDRALRFEAQERFASAAEFDAALRLSSPA